MALRRRKPLGDADRGGVIVGAPDLQLLNPGADSAQALLDLQAPALSSLWSSSHLFVMPAFPPVATGPDAAGGSSASMRGTDEPAEKRRARPVREIVLWSERVGGRRGSWGTCSYRSPP